MIKEIHVNLNGLSRAAALAEIERTTDNAIAHGMRKFHRMMLEHDLAPDFMLSELVSMRQYYEDHKKRIMDEWRAELAKEAA